MSTAGEGVKASKGLRGLAVPHATLDAYARMQPMQPRRKWTPCPDVSRP